MHFLSTNLISFRRSSGIILFMAAPAREMDSSVDSEIQRKMRDRLEISGLKGYQVEALEAVCFQQRDTLVSVPTGSRNLRVSRECTP